MASVQERAGKFQLRVVNKLLPKPFFFTFDNEVEANAYGVQLESLLDRGIVPVELLEVGKRGDNPALKRLIDDALADASIAPSDKATLKLLGVAVGAVRLLSVNAAWADAWVVKMKVEQHLAPSTIRKRVESLARVLDNYWRLQTGRTAPANPLRLMPRGYSQATEREAAMLLDKKLRVKRDVQRDRRLSLEEQAACRLALAGEKRHGRERALEVDPLFELLFNLIANTGLRLVEAYSLRVDQIDLVRWVIKVDGSKGHRGVIKPRVVPLVPDLRKPLADRCAVVGVGLIFTFWDGTPEDKRKATGRLSSRFATLFDFAGVDDCTEHDLRHEATCRWVVLRDPAGRWVFSEIEICKIMGWSDTRMMLRYASLRGEDLSARLG